jgi:hypothetical protein
MENFLAVVVEEVGGRRCTRRTEQPVQHHGADTPIPTGLASVRWRARVGRRARADRTAAIRAGVGAPARRRRAGSTLARLAYLGSGTRDRLAEGAGHGHGHSAVVVAARGSDAEPSPAVAGLARGRGRALLRARDTRHEAGGNCQSDGQRSAEPGQTERPHDASPEHRACREQPAREGARFLPCMATSHDATITAWHTSASRRVSATAWSPSPLQRKPAGWLPQAPESKPLGARWGDLSWSCASTLACGTGYTCSDLATMALLRRLVISMVSASSSPPASTRPQATWTSRYWSA